MNNSYTKWVATWGNAPSITDREISTYAKDLTLRYPVRMNFDGDKLRFHFSNITGTEQVNIEYVSIAEATDSRSINESTSTFLTFNGARNLSIAPGSEVVSDEIAYDVKCNETISVNIYIKDFTQMNTGVWISGPLSKAYYSYGEYATSATLPMNLTRSTNWFYFLTTIDVHTTNENRAIICYGDSITAQDWPDYLTLRAYEEGIKNVSFIRRAISGTRILREYDCITYAAYGAKGERRFEREIKVAGADTVIIQHGINDIIHPVGEEVNPFRPMSDLPSAEDLADGVSSLYVSKANDAGLRIVSATLLPIYGWRTYADFRDEIKDKFNDYLRTSNEFELCIDFHKALQDDDNKAAFKPEYDSGDHLHPSPKGYEQMGNTAFEALRKARLI